MKHIYFNTEKEARDYIGLIASGFREITNEVVFVYEDSLSSEILSQEHFCFYDHLHQVKHYFSYFKRLNEFTVEYSEKKMSSFVLSCEIGDIDFFNKLIQDFNSGNALALGFKFAIYNDHLHIVKEFVEKDYLKGVRLYDKPIITTTIKDSLDCFIYLLPKFEIPQNILAQILRHNAIYILDYIISNKDFNEIIFTTKHKEDFWVKRILSDPKQFNDAVEIYCSYFQK